jgi:hypothetical protein
MERCGEMLIGQHSWEAKAISASNFLLAILVSKFPLANSVSYGDL